MKPPVGPSAASVVIVGRPNVGKSTLFNRLCGRRRAITSPVAGTTRDWIEGVCHWNGRAYRVIDTGGYAPGEDILASVRAQVEEWIGRAEAVVWVVDAGEGRTPSDESFARLLRPVARRVVLAVNKADDADREAAVGDFARLGFERVVGLSATHGRRVNVLLDAVETLIGEGPGEEEAGEAVPVAIVGRPNVGKSSLVNRLLGTERMIVSAAPGTTRDTADSVYQWRDRRFLLIDTAGLRARKSRADDLEGLTRLMTERALERAEVAVLLVDAVEGLTDGDAAVGRLVHATRRSCVVGLNKWDRLEDPGPVESRLRRRAAEGMPFLAHAPVVPVSAKTGFRLDELFRTVAAAADGYRRRFEAEDLTAFFWKTVQDRPYAQGARKLVFHGAAQAAAAPPTILIRTNMDPSDIHFSYVRHLERTFREARGLPGVPIIFRFRRGKR